MINSNLGHIVHR